MKTCRKCKLQKSLDSFNKSTYRPDGLKDWCKLCQKEDSRQRLIKNGGKPYDTDRSKETKNLKVCTKCKLLKDRNKFGTSTHCYDCRVIYTREKYYNGNKKFIPIVNEDSKQCCNCKEIKILNEYSDSIRGRLGKSSYCKECTRIKANNLPRELKNKQVQKYRNNNREYWRSLHRINQFNRKNNIKLTSDGSITKEFILSILNNEICYYCNQKIEFNNRTIEHKIPLSRGGKHISTNITMACLSCNTSKRNKTEEEYNIWKSKVLKQKLLQTA